MTRIAIDGMISELAPESNEQVENALREALTRLPANRMITKIIIDGKEVSSLSIDENSPAFHQLEIKTVDKEIWAVNGLDIALSSCERVQRSLIRVAELFRDDHKAQGNRLFVQCVDGLERFYEALMITRTVLKLDFNLIEVETLRLADIERDFALILKAIIELQEKQDWNGLAEKIDFELITNLSCWNTALKSLKRSQNSNA